MKPVSVIGLGAMGSALARTLLAHRYPVTVWNRSPEKAEPLVALGASLAGSPADAVSASTASIVCVKSHLETRKLLAEAPDVLPGKTIMELSTGDVSDAQELVGFLKKNNACYLLGIINAYPTGIGKAETTIITVGAQSTWDEYASVIRTLGGRSTWIGDRPTALAAMFAALFTARQAFMFGMIYGALVCKKAGVPVEAVVDQIPVSMAMINDYYHVFASTVPSENYADPPASMSTYAHAIKGALGTFESFDARSELPRLMFELTQAGVDAGHGDEQLTALVSFMEGN